jgi:hypothetical protein
MKSMFTILNRTILVMGLLLALTPCGVCRGTSMAQASVCPMKKMGNMNCCSHCQSHKSHSPLCKVMDQSTLPVAGAHLNVADVPAVSYAVVPPSFLRMANVSPKIIFDTSPPKPLVLRI